MYRYSICDPLKPEIIEMGNISKDEVMDILNKFPWFDLLKKMDDTDPAKVYYAPSIEFENKDNHHGLAISIVGDEKDYEFYIFYKRPKMRVRLFGLIKYLNKDYLSDRTQQSLTDVQECVQALLNNDFVTLEKRWG